MLFIIYLSYIFLTQLLLEARAEIQKYFSSFFGSNENFRICFWDFTDVQYLKSTWLFNLENNFITNKQRSLWIPIVTAVGLYNNNLLATHNLYCASLTRSSSKWMGRCTKSRPLPSGPYHRTYVILFTGPLEGARGQ